MTVSALSATEAPRGSADIAAINITPLVDVLLVLLIIFMVASPTLTRHIDLDLPQPAPLTPPPPARILQLHIDASGQLTWNGVGTALTALPALMAAEARREPGRAPLLRIDASGEADYGLVTKVLAAARNADLERIAFVAH